MTELTFERARYAALCERLLAEEPEIDERTLRDTVEGLSNYTDALAAIVRAVLEDEAHAEALRAMIDENVKRLHRFQDRAFDRRNIVRDEMEQAGLHKLTMPDFTASLRSGSPAVVVIDEKLIPAEYFEFRAHLKKRELLDAMKSGIPVEGASLNNPRMSLSVRTR